MVDLYAKSQTDGEYLDNAVSFIMSGVVLATDDPDQMGRVRVWIPALDGAVYDIANIPWADYASPFMGYTVEYPAGEAIIKNNSDAAYGFWAIPKVGATVYVFCLNGDADQRVFFAGSARLHRNRSLPAGRNLDDLNQPGPWGDTGDGSGRLNAIQPAYDNIRTQFQGLVNSPQAKTRGAYERQAAQAKTDKDGAEGYSTNPADPSYLDPQTYCFSTPGRHALIMQDDPRFSRLRIKTAEGHQVIFDDANERIYISTSKGFNWIEMDQDGHINIYGGDSISIRSGGDLNFFADKNINFEASGGINMRATGGDLKLAAQGNMQMQVNGNIVQTACGFFDMSSETNLKLTAASNLDIHAHANLALTGDSAINAKTSQGVKIQGSSGIDIKGGAVKIGGTSVDVAGGAVTVTGAPLSLNKIPAQVPSDATAATDASCAESADSPSIIPGHEPWTRPISNVPRGPNWSE